MSSNEKLMSTVLELRAEVEKNFPNIEKVDSLHKSLDTLEAANQEIVAKAAQQEKHRIEMEEKMNGLEVALARRSSEPGKSNYKESAEYKAMNAFMAMGGNITAEQKDLLRTDSESQGGFLVPREMDTAIIKKITEISPIRSIARVRTVSGKTLELPVRNSIPTATYEGEAQPSGESNSTYASETITPYRLTNTSPITNDMLMDAAFDMESEIFSDAAEAFAYVEGRAFILGDGIKKPRGFLDDPRVTDSFRESVTSGVLDTEDIIRVTGDLKTGYNPVFVLNRRTLAELRTQKSTTGQYIWTPGINGVVANSLAGVNYVIANDMPDIASGAMPVAYGDFMRGYTIVDRTGLVVIRDDITQKKEAIVEFTMRRYNTGQVTLPEALTGIKIKL